MAQVWGHSRQSGGALLVLLALADFADDQGRSWPSVPVLAEKARMSERNARYVLRSLETAGEIATIIGGGRRGTSGYLVTIGADIAPANPAGGQSLPGGKTQQKRGNLRQKRGQPIAPEPSLTTKEPSEKIPATADAAPAIPPKAPTFTDQVGEAVQRSLGSAPIRLKGGHWPKWLADIAIVLDEHTGHDAGLAVASWCSWVDSDAWPYKGTDRAKWAGSLGDWLTNGRGRPSTNSRPTNATRPGFHDPAVKHKPADPEYAAAVRAYVASLSTDNPLPEPVRPHHD